jgi:MtN3 and saliva related transmembrane protein
VRYRPAHMNDFLIFAVGLGAALGTTGAWFPQIARTWKTHRATDFSWGYLALLATGVALWTTYGLLRGDLVVIVGNGVTLLLVSSVAFVKSKERRPSSPAPSTPFL